MENSALRKPPKIELSFRSFKLLAEGLEAVQVVQWPMRLLLAAVAASILIVAYRFQPVSWLVLAWSYVSSLL